MSENSLPCQIEGCPYSATHVIKEFGFCCSCFEAGQHNFLHSEISRITGQFNWNVRTYENAIAALKNQLLEERQEANAQYLSLAKTCQELLGEKENGKTKRRKAKA